MLTVEPSVFMELVSDRHEIAVSTLGGVGSELSTEFVLDKFSHSVASLEAFHSSVALIHVEKVSVGSELLEVPHFAEVPLESGFHEGVAQNLHVH